MYAVFFVCFGVGLGYTIISFLLGNLMDGLGMGADADVSGVDFDTGGVEAGPGDTAGGGGAGQISPLKPVVIASFITVFGGVGLLMLRLGINEYVAATIAGFAALSVAFLLYRYIIVPLYRFQSTSAIAQKELIGKRAQVTLRIPQGQYGKIAYVVNGSKFSAPAKSKDGGAVPVGAAVEIMYIERNTFFIKTINEEVN